MKSSSPLVAPDWLETRLGKEDVVPLDCRVRRVTHPNGPSTFESCESEWEQARIPGAGYVHFVDDLSDPSNCLPFMFPPITQVGSVLGRFGITEQTTVVVYGEAADMGAHRVWWVLTVSGHRDVRVLDGGFSRWRAEGRALASGDALFEKTTYMPKPDMSSIADRRGVAAAIGDPSTCLINALSEELFRGEGNQVFGRRGHIPDSVNVPADDLIDPTTGCFRPGTEIRAIFDDRIPTQCNRMIPYCGGGIAASTVALALAVAGRTDVCLYDGSLLDWTQDPNSPMSTGAS